MNNWDPWQLKKSKSWGPFWSYQLNSSANSAYSPLKWVKWAELAWPHLWSSPELTPQNWKDFEFYHGLIDIKANFTYSKFDVCLTTAWRMCDDCLMTAWRLPDGCLTAAWQLPDEWLITSWRLKMTAWWQRDNALTTAWKLPDDCLTTAWWLSDDCLKLLDNYLMTA